jgi:hypothetical protein
MKANARERLLIVSLFATLTLSGCGLLGDKDEEGGLSPTPSAPPSAAPTDTPGAQPLPATTGAATPPGKTPTISPPASKPDAGAPSDAGASTPDAAAPSDAGAASSSLKVCAEKCQAVLQNCLTPVFPKDGGFPQIKDPAACQAAADACRAGCKP